MCRYCSLHRAERWALSWKGGTARGSGRAAAQSHCIGLCEERDSKGIPPFLAPESPLFLVREAHAEAVEPRPQSKWDVDRADTAAAERVRRLAAAARDAIVFAPCEYVAMPILAAAPSHPSSPRARPRRISLSLPSLSLSLVAGTQNGVFLSSV